jgi:uncharacterized protein with GYD domain
LVSGGHAADPARLGNSRRIAWPAGQAAKEKTVPHYMVQLSYTPEAWAAQLKDPRNRVEIVRPVLEKAGARFEATYMTFGEYDLVFIMEAPDNVSAASLSLAFTAGGSVKTIKTTPLLTIDDGVAAMRKAGELASAYRPPTG